MVEKWIGGVDAKIDILMAKWDRLEDVIRTSISFIDHEKTMYHLEFFNV